MTYRLIDLVLYFFKLGYTGFGGPVALVGYMHRDLIENKKWFTEETYKEGMTLAQLAPGPMATQLAIYLGYVDYGVWGATAVGIAFVIPSFVMVVILGYLYKLYGGLAWMQAVFYAVGASVIGIITLSAYKLSQKTMGKDLLLWVVFITSALVTFITENEWVLLFLAGGLLNYIVKTPPAFLSKRNFQEMGSFLLTPFFVGSPIASSETYLQIALFFSKAGAFVFGSGLAIVPFLYSGVVA